MTSAVVLTWDDDEGASQFAGIFRDLGVNVWKPGGPAAFRILAETATVLIPRAENVRVVLDVTDPHDGSTHVCDDGQDCSVADGLLR